MKDLDPQPWTQGLRQSGFRRHPYLGAIMARFGLSGYPRHVKLCHKGGRSGHDHQELLEANAQTFEITRD